MSGKFLKFESKSETIYTFVSIIHNHTSDDLVDVDGDSKKDALREAVLKFVETQVIYRVDSAAAIPCEITKTDKKVLKAILGIKKIREKFIDLDMGKSISKLKDYGVIYRSDSSLLHVNNLYKDSINQIINK